MSEPMADQTVRTSFNAKPRNLPTELRRNWRLPLVVLVIDACHGHQATDVQVHLLSWMLLRPSVRANLGQVVRTGFAPDRSVVRYEPALQRALDLVVGFGWAERTTTGRYKATVSGRALANGFANAGIFEQERAALASLPRRFTQTDATRLLDTTLLGLS